MTVIDLETRRAIRECEQALADLYTETMQLKFERDSYRKALVAIVASAARHEPLVQRFDDMLSEANMALARRFEMYKR